jgi:hypothetical protein
MLYMNYIVFFEAEYLCKSSYICEELSDLLKIPISIISFPYQDNEP